MPISLRPAQHATEPGEGFGEGVDLLAEHSPLPFVDLLVADPALALTIGCHLPFQVLEAGLYLCHEVGILSLYDGLDELEGDFGPSTFAAMS